MSINLSGHLFEMTHPVVMGILNVTPDSFYASSRAESEEAIRQRALQIIHEGGEIIDVGACSTRPGSHPVKPSVELQRLDKALEVVRTACPKAVVSVDTFRAEVARYCIEKYHVDIINDVSGGDDAMLQVVAEKGVPYILTGISPNNLAVRLQDFHEAGVADVIIDPGFGFHKTLEQDYNTFAHIADYKRLFPSQPILVGISRKSMICKVLHCTPEEALIGTTVLNTLALQAGANILRVHDVAAAVQAVKLIEML